MNVYELLCFSTTGHLLLITKHLPRCKSCGEGTALLCLMNTVPDAVHWGE